MKLRYSTTSPFVRKVHVLAIETGLIDKMELVPTTTADFETGDLRFDNPLGKVPALVLDDGGVLIDSRLICEWIDHQTGGKFFPPAGPARWTALKRQVLGDGILDAGVLRMMEIRRSDSEQSAHWILRQSLKITRALDALEADHLGPQLDIGTLTIAIALDYLDFRFKTEDWRKTRPHLAAWHKTFSERAVLKKTLPHD